MSSDNIFAELDQALDTRERLFVLHGKIPPDYYVSAIAERLNIEVWEVEFRLNFREK